MADQCDVCGGDAKSYGPRGRRCLACLAADDPALRSDVPVLGECDWGPLCVHIASVRRLRIRLAFAEIARAEAVRCHEHTDRCAAETSADAAHAALDATTERLVAAADILRRYGDIGAQAALRALEGETT